MWRNASGGTADKILGLLQFLRHVIEAEHAGKARPAPHVDGAHASSVAGGSGAGSLRGGGGSCRGSWTAAAGHPAGQVSAQPDSVSRKSCCLRLKCHSSAAALLSRRLCCGAACAQVCTGRRNSEQHLGCGVADARSIRRAQPEWLWGAADLVHMCLAARR